MKYGAFLLIVVLSAGPLFAHPPSAIDIKANGAAVEITVEHAVSDPADHYIREIKVSAGRKEMIRQEFVLQTGNVQKAVYLIPSIKPGNLLKVEAFCSKFGKRDREIVVE